MLQATSWARSKWHSGWLCKSMEWSCQNECGGHPWVHGDDKLILTRIHLQLTFLLSCNSMIHCFFKHCGDPIPNIWKHFSPGGCQICAVREVVTSREGLELVFCLHLGASPLFHHILKLHRHIWILYIYIYLYTPQLIRNTGKPTVLGLWSRALRPTQTGQRLWRKWAAGQKNPQRELRNHACICVKCHMQVSYGGTPKSYVLFIGVSRYHHLWNHPI